MSGVRDAVSVWSQGLHPDIPSRALSHALIHSRALSCPLVPSRTLSYPLVPSRTLSYPLIPSGTLSYRFGLGNTLIRAELVSEFHLRLGWG